MDGWMDREKPRIKECNIHPDRLRGLPDGTLGREYVRFMDHYVSDVIDWQT
jgi:ubiquinone biosynthesis protein Coq4